MTKDYTQLAIENGAKGLKRGIVYFEEIAEFNATIEAAIKQAFDEAEVVACMYVNDENECEEISVIGNYGGVPDEFIPLIAKRVDK